MVCFLEAQTLCQLFIPGISFGILQNSSGVGEGVKGVLTFDTGEVAVR